MMKKDKINKYVKNILCESVIIYDLIFSLFIKSFNR